MEHPGTHHHDGSEHRHEWKPVDQSYHIVVRTVLWVIAGAVFIALAVWWFLT